MNMKLLQFVFLSLVYEIRAINIIGKEYKIGRGKKALLNVAAVTGARSALECATKCAASNICTHANFRNASCEFLKYESHDRVIGIEEDANSKYICKCNLSILKFYFISDIL